MFKVGQTVTMVAPCNFESMLPDELQPSFGEVYTIRGIAGRHDGLVGLIFNEIKNPTGRYSDTPEAAFNSIRFRPVIETDISALKALLVPGARIIDPTSAPTRPEIPVNVGGDNAF